MVHRQALCTIVVHQDVAWHQCKIGLSFQLPTLAASDPATSPP
jgi:hypothetical protein